MAANPFTRGTCPGRARPIHRGGFKMGHAKRGGRQKGTPNAISLRARTAIVAAAKPQAYLWKLPLRDALQNIGGENATSSPAQRPEPAWW